MTLVKEQKKYSLYFDKKLASSSDIKGKVEYIGGYMYIGGDPWHAGATGAQYDNI